MTAARQENPADLGPAGRGLRLLVLAMAALSALALAALTLITCVDVVGRKLGHPLVGSYDLVRICGAVTIGMALPLTTAVKGHIAIEYFFHKLGRRGRLVVDSLMRLIQMTFFCVAAWQFWKHGMRFLRSGEVTPTLQLPLFWVPWLVAGACMATALVTLWHLLRPHKDLVKP